MPKSGGMMKGIFFIFLVFTLIFAGCDSQGGLKKWVMYRRNAPIADADYPLEVLKDGYRATKIYEFGGKEKVEWMWMITVRNKSDSDIMFKVTYLLKDKDSSNLAVETVPVRVIEPDEVMTIKEDAIWDISLEDFKRIDKSTFQIDHRKPDPWEIY